MFHDRFSSFRHPFARIRSFSLFRSVSVLLFYNSTLCTYPTTTRISKILSLFIACHKCKQFLLMRRKKRRTRQLNHFVTLSQCYFFCTVHISGRASFCLLLSIHFFCIHCLSISIPLLPSFVLFQTKIFVFSRHCYATC